MGEIYYPPVYVNNNGNRNNTTFSNATKCMWGLGTAAIAGGAAYLLKNDSFESSNKAPTSPLDSWREKFASDYNKLKGKCAGWIEKSEVLKGTKDKWKNLGTKTKSGLKAAGIAGAVTVGLMTAYNFLFAKKDV